MKIEAKIKYADGCGELGIIYKGEFEWRFLPKDNGSIAEDQLEHILKCIKELKKIKTKYG